jgi:hypothetical protein
VSPRLRHVTTFETKPLVSGQKRIPMTRSAETDTATWDYAENRTPQLRRDKSRTQNVSQRTSMGHRDVEKDIRMRNLH